MTRLSVLAGLTLAAAAAVFAVINDRAGVPPAYVQRPADIALAAALAAFVIVGGVLGARHPIGRLLILEGLVWELGLACAGYVNHAVYTAPGSLPAPVVADWLLGWIWVPGVIGLPLILLVFPDGRPPSRRWWPVAWLALAAAVALPPAPALGGPLLSATIVLALVSLAARHRRADALERARLRWFACAAGLIVLALLAASAVGSAGGYLNVFPLAAIPLAIGVAVRRDRLYELETLIDRTLLAAVLAAAVTLVFFGVIVVTGVVAGGPIATAVVAVAIQPLRARAQRLTSKVAYRIPQPEVEIETLGGFRVLRGGRPVECRSKKARTLLKILVARRGRPVPREQLMELLWPDEDPAKLGNRLSVALTALRTALGREPDVIRSDADAVALDLTRVAVDVERFLAEVERGHFARAERLYAGDFLEEDAYADWAGDLRVQARAAYAVTLRARIASAGADQAIRACLRLLELDPYDAGAHRALIARLDGAGRHGEAIERRRTYIRSMHEIGVRAAF